MKAIYVTRLKKQSVFTHDLLRLAKSINLEISVEQEELLDKITTFNLNTRYDDYKQKFRKISTKEFTDIWINNIKEVRLWLINQLSKVQKDI
jgi:HEPN domain-containing protein